MDKMDKYRKSVGELLWSYFKDVDDVSVQCLLCSQYLHKQGHGSTTQMLRHLRVKHPAEVSGKEFFLNAERAASQEEDESLEIDGDQIISVVVEMEEGVSDVKTPPNDSDASPPVSAFPETFQQVSAEQLPVEPSDDNPAKNTRRRSLIWRLFEHVESLNAARCLICMKKLHESGGVSNLRRHLNKRHPKVLSELLASSHQRPSLEDGADVDIHENEHDPVKVVVGGDTGVLTELTETANNNGLLNTLQQGSARMITPAEEGSNVNAGTGETSWKDTQKWIPEALENGNADITTRSNKMPPSDEIDSAINGLLQTLQKGSVQATCAGESEEQSAKKTRRRSLIWHHFKRLESLNAAQCQICMKKLQCFESGCTSNLHRHMSKRHPKVFSKLASNQQQRSPPNTNLKNDGANRSYALRKHNHQIPVPAGELKASREPEVESRILMQEKELIDALRRTQREEARTLNDQRELVEKLRAASAREAAAEREKIESLRKAQQEEAKELSRQREEIESEKTELQKRWEELHREREELLLLSREKKPLDDVLT